MKTKNVLVNALADKFFGMLFISRNFNRKKWIKLRLNRPLQTTLKTKKRDKLLPCSTPSLVIIN